MTREQIAAALKRPETLRYVNRFGGLCRDCDNQPDGICETSGLPCRDPQSKAVRFVLRAVSYGIEHGFLEIPEINN